MQGARAETCIVQKKYENKKFQICNSYNRFSLMWEKSMNMNYELEYNRVINLTHTLVRECFDSLLSFSSIQSDFFVKNIFTLWIEIFQDNSFKSVCMSRSPLLCRTSGPRRLFYKEMEMRRIYIEVF